MKMIKFKKKNMKLLSKEQHESCENAAHDQFENSLVA